MHHEMATQIEANDGISPALAATARDEKVGGEGLVSFSLS